MNVLSHISEESSEAQGIKTSLENVKPSTEVFVSKVNIQCKALKFSRLVG